MENTSSTTRYLKGMASSARLRALLAVVVLGFCIAHSVLLAVVAITVLLFEATHLALFRMGFFIFGACAMIATISKLGLTGAIMTALTVGAVMYLHKKLKK